MSAAPSMPDVELLRRDVHPAEISLDGEVWTGVRVFVTTRRLVALHALSDGSIHVALDLPLEQPCSVPGNRGTLIGCLEARLADGRTAWINPGRGCGCGSPLKALGPLVPWTSR